MEKNDAKFTMSVSEILKQHDVAEKITDILSYSSKTNSHVTPILEEQRNCEFSIHFINELLHVKDKSRVLFLAQGWDIEEIRNLREMGVSKFVVDNVTDLDLLLNYLEENNDHIELMLRLKLRENTLKTERYFVFGMPLKVVETRVSELKNNAHITSLGIHFHRKTQNMAEWNLKYEIENMFEKNVIDAIDILNIGGGLPSEYANTNIKVLDSVFKKIGELKTYLNENGVKLMIEPGRFISAPAGKLITRITAIYDGNIIVNASVYNSDMDALIVPVKLLVENELKKNEGDAYVIKGMTPCSLDLFRYKVYLKNPKVGDEVVFLNAGAYNFTTNFCDLKELKTELVE